MSFVEAGGALYASAGVAVYRRVDGEAPSWEKVYSGGFDFNFFPALDTAWIFRAPVETVLGRANGTSQEQ